MQLTPCRTFASTNATSSKPGVPVVSEPERFSAVPPPFPGMGEEEYMERQMKLMRAIVGRNDITPDVVLRERITRDVDRAYLPRCDASHPCGAWRGRSGCAGGGRPKCVGVDPQAELSVITGLGHYMPDSLVRTVADARSVRG